MNSCVRTHGASGMTSSTHLKVVDRYQTISGRKEQGKISVLKLALVGSCYYGLKYIIFSKTEEA
jgi:hypothetical protein